MNQQIVDYLNQYKNQFPKETLIEQLRQSYSEEEIQEAVNYVYGAPQQAFVQRQQLTRNAEPVQTQPENEGGSKKMLIIGLIVVIAVVLVLVLFLLMPEMIGLSSTTNTGGSQDNQGDNTGDSLFMNQPSDTGSNDSSGSGSTPPPGANPPAIASFKYTSVSNLLGAESTVTVWKKGDNIKSDMTTIYPPGNMIYPDGKTERTITLLKNDEIYTYNPDTNIAKKQMTTEELSNMALVLSSSFAMYIKPYATDQELLNLMKSDDPTKDVRIAGQDNVAGKSCTIFESSTEGGTQRVCIASEGQFTYLLKMETIQGGQTVMDYEFKDVEINPTIPDSVFELPAGAQIMDLDTFCGDAGSIEDYGNMVIEVTGLETHTIDGKSISLCCTIMTDESGSSVKTCDDETKEYSLMFEEINGVFVKTVENFPRNGQSCSITYDPETGAKEMEFCD